MNLFFQQYGTCYIRWEISERIMVFVLDQNLERTLSQRTGRQGACQRAP